MLTHRADATQGGPSSSQDPLIPRLNLDNESLEIDETMQLRLQALEYNFISKKQFWRILTSGLGRSFYTLATAVLLVVAIWEFSLPKRKVISNKGKRWFNVINTGLSLALGMSLAHGFKAMAIDLRWWILSRHRRPLSEVSKCDTFCFPRKPESDTTASIGIYKADVHPTLATEG